MGREQEPLRGERLNDGLSAVAAGTGSPLVILPGFGPGADLSERVPRSAAWSIIALARGFRRRIHLIHRPLHPPAGLTMGISAGGVTALQLELDHPGTVRHLVLCCAASQVGPQGLGELQRLIEAEGQGRSSARIGSGLIAHGPLRLHPGPGRPA